MSRENMTQLVMAACVVALLIGWCWFWTGPELQWERELAARSSAHPTEETKP